MGVSVLGRSSSSSYGCSSSPSVPPQLRPAGNPDPHNYRIGALKYVGAYMVLAVKYPNCKNYEGKKILVYKDVELEQLLHQPGGIDPHFSDATTNKSPIARFQPTDQGWDMAVTFCGAMTHE